MNVTTIRGRNGKPISLERLLIGGVDIGTLLAQLNGSGMATASNIVTLTEKYTTTAAGVGYAAGQTLRRTELVDTSTAPPTSTVYWYNFSTGATLTVAPDMTSLTLVSQSGLTNVELRATPVIIKTDPTSADVVALGDPNALMAEVDGSGAVTVVSGIKRLISTMNVISNKLPASLGQATAAHSIPVVINSDEWVGAGYTLGTDGNLISERQSNGSQIRTRTWTTTVAGNGQSTSTPGVWVYS